MTKVDLIEKRRPDGAALIIAAGLAGLGGLLVWQAGTIPDKGGYAGVGSGDVPRFVGYVLWLLAGAHVVTALRGSAGGRMYLQAAPVFWVVGGLLLQLVLMRPLGFSIASALLFAMTATGFGKRNPVLTLPIGLALALLIYGVFDQLLKLKLPTGFLETLIFGG